MALPQGPFYFALGDRIRRARKKRKLTQDKLAKAVGLTRTSVTNIETGRQPIYIHTLVRIAELLGEPLLDLIPNPNIIGSPTKPADQLQHLKPDTRQWVSRVLQTSPNQETKHNGT